MIPMKQLRQKISKKKVSSTVLVAWVVSWLIGWLGCGLIQAIELTNGGNHGTRTSG